MILYKYALVLLSYCLFTLEMNDEKIANSKYVRTNDPANIYNQKSPMFTNARAQFDMVCSFSCCLAVIHQLITIIHQSTIILTFYLAFQLSLVSINKLSQNLIYFFVISERLFNFFN